MSDDYTPRVLRLTFEFHVPKGLRRDIRGSRLEAAVERFTGAIETLAPLVFPWADRMIATYDWSYRWTNGRDIIDLPATSDNTVKV